LRKHRGRLQTESLTIVQRFGSSLTLNVHFHAIVMDGVYAEQPDGSLLFHPLSLGPRARAPTHRRPRCRARRKARYRLGRLPLRWTGFAPAGRHTEFHEFIA
jgi:Putative transposase